MTIRIRPIRALAVLAGALILTTTVAAQATRPNAAVTPKGLEPNGSANAAAARTAPAEWLGRSGALRALIATPTNLVRDEFVRGLLSFNSGVRPGLHDLGIATPQGDPFYVVSLVPYGQKKGATLNGYRIGQWPAAARGAYTPPAGFIEVTAENQATPVSEQFRLRDFLTHDQGNVWPKYLVLQPKLLDKLELISSELERRGLPSRLHVMSGFRTPQYNAQGVGEGGRAGKSRHMYGDAADVFVDADEDGMMDDLNGDGRSTLDDARVLYAAAESVEAGHPDLVGGLAPYKANSAHGPFVHVDARGTRARW